MAEPGRGEIVGAEAAGISSIRWRAVRPVPSPAMAAICAATAITIKGVRIHLAFRHMIHRPSWCILQVDEQSIHA